MHRPLASRSWRKYPVRRGCRAAAGRRPSRPRRPRRLRPGCVRQGGDHPAIPWRSTWRTPAARPSTSPPSRSRSPWPAAAASPSPGPISTRRLHPYIFAGNSLFGPRSHDDRHDAGCLGRRGLGLHDPGRRCDPGSGPGVLRRRQFGPEWPGGRLLDTLPGHQPDRPECQQHPDRHAEQRHDHDFAGFHPRALVPGLGHPGITGSGLAGPQDADDKCNREGRTPRSVTGPVRRRIRHRRGGGGTPSSTPCARPRSTPISRRRSASDIGRKSLATATFRSMNSTFGMPQLARLTGSERRVGQQLLDREPRRRSGPGRRLSWRSRPSACARPPATPVPRSCRSASGVAFMPPWPSAMRASAALSAIWVQSKSCRSRRRLQRGGGGVAGDADGSGDLLVARLVEHLQHAVGASIAARSSSSRKAWMCRTSRRSVCSRLRLSSSCRFAVVGLAARELRGQDDLLAPRGHQPADPLLALAVAVGVGGVDVGDPQVDRVREASRALSSSCVHEEPAPRAEAEDRDLEARLAEGSGGDPGGIPGPQRRVMAAPTAAASMNRRLVMSMGGTSRLGLRIDLADSTGSHLPRRSARSPVNKPSGEFVQPIR